MGFQPISIDLYVKMYHEKNPSIDEMDLKKRLEAALTDYAHSVKCGCGQDIWVIGSAHLGNSCFSCITNGDEPNGDFEIESAMLKCKTGKKPRHIDDMKNGPIRGIFTDEGYEIDTSQIKKPPLCFSCQLDDDSSEEILCLLTRASQRNDPEFKCEAYIKRMY